jgi:hypothetical protein
VPALRYTLDRQQCAWPAPGSPPGTAPGGASGSTADTGASGGVQDLGVGGFQADCHDYTGTGLQQCPVAGGGLMACAPLRRATGLGQVRGVAAALAARGLGQGPEAGAGG